MSPHIPLSIPLTLAMGLMVATAGCDSTPSLPTEEVREASEELQEELADVAEEAREIVEEAAEALEDAGKAVKRNVRKVWGDEKTSTVQRASDAAESESREVRAESHSATSEAAGRRVGGT